MNDLRRLLIATGMIATPWLIVACGNKSGSDDDNDGGSGRSGICTAICEKAEECGVGSRMECVQACNNDDVSSSAALQVVEICAEDVSCTGFEDGTLAECVSEGIADLDASTAAEDYCDTLIDWYTDCGGEPLSPAECYSSANAVSSAYLAEIEACLSEGCVDATTCLESVEARYDVGDSIIQLVADGFGGSDPACCSAGDPCAWANDNVCDCSGDFAWDAADCSTEPDPTTCAWPNDGECDEPDLCAVGTDTVDCGGTVDCCAAGDPCDWAGDNVCDCGGELAWDAADCGVVAGPDSCIFSRDGVCDVPVDCAAGTDTTDCSAAGPDSCQYALDNICDEPEFCVSGTDTTDCGGTVDCCAADDPCDWAGDNVCDCSGEYAWDAVDCGDTAGNTCTYAYDNICDEPTSCAYGTDASDCADSCCNDGDPCDWASDDVCDCQGAFAWDAVDCGL